MASKSVESYREGAEVYHGDTLCKNKSVELLEELGLPNGLLGPLDDIEEFGYNRDAGFVWLTQKKTRDRVFKQQIKRTVSYAPKVTAFVEPRKMKMVTGVLMTTKEVDLGGSVVEMYIDDDPTLGNITFKTGTGAVTRFPASAFQIREVRKGGHHVFSPHHLHTLGKIPGSLVSLISFAL